MIDFAMLDNPIWFALNSIHQPLAQTNGHARRYPADVSPFAALETDSASAFSDLSALITDATDHVAMCTAEPLNVPAGWQVVRDFQLDQMICPALIGKPPASMIELDDTDVPEMLALTSAAKPGPFLRRTIRMGSYFGVRAADNRLAAMAGVRLQLPRFTEISAVCTDPDFRGQGYARGLVSGLAHRILHEGKTPFLHVTPDNSAKHLYRSLGFVDRRAVCLTVIGRG